MPASPLSPFVPDVYLITDQDWEATGPRGESSSDHGHILSRPVPERIVYTMREDGPRTELTTMIGADRADDGRRRAAQDGALCARTHAALPQLLGSASENLC